MMRRNLFLIVALPFALHTWTSAQAGSVADLRADQQRLRQQESQLDLDRNRLIFDRRHGASRTQLQSDEALVRQRPRANQDAAC